MKAVPTGRIRRVAKLGGLATGLAGSIAGAAGRLALGRDTASAHFHRRAAETLLASLDGMKGLPMKLGQMLSYVDDLVPPEHRAIYRETLGKLQASGQSLPFEVVRPIIEEDIGPIDDSFAEFDETPIAAASIGQVFRARLHDGREVAVKVQYPGIADAVRADLKNADSLVGAFGLVLPKVEIQSAFDELSTLLIQECDYAHELANQVEMARLFADDPDVVIPDVVPEQSGPRVLTTVLVRGRTWDDVVASADRVEQKRLGGIIFRFVFRAAYVHGVVNADPHPRRGKRWFACVTPSPPVPPTTWCGRR